ncbi:DUF1345 domain-containing protein [Sphingomonas koreensis]
MTVRETPTAEKLGRFDRLLFGASAVSEWSVILAAATWLLAPALTDAMTLALFDAVGIMHLVLYWTTLAVSNRLSQPQRKQLRRSRRRHGLGTRVSMLFAMLASLSGIIGAFTVQFYAGEAPDAPTKYLAIGCILVAWMLLHVGYARFYESLQNSLGQEALVIRGAENGGRLVDFAYFSFTIGTSFAVSDIVVAHPRVRLHVLSHSIISFFYNSAVLALAVGMITGR